jgi:tRNA threonylcarbamoyladenosine biosynthesis protein TsaE
MKRVTSASAAETQAMGRTLAAELVPGDVVALTGDLGSGKTQCVIGICEGLGVRTHVASPTFTIVNEYRAASCTVVHVDLYRIDTAAELAELGLQEYFFPPFVCVIEWAERARPYLPVEAWWVTLQHTQDPAQRVIMIERGEQDSS